MILSTLVLGVLALLALAIPALFLVILGVAAVRRSRGGDVGPRTAGTLALLGGLALGMLLLFGATDLLTALPLLAAAGLFALRQWRNGQRAQAGLIVTGTALPWTVLWAVYLGALVLKLERFDPGQVWPAFLSGLIATVAGLVVVVRGDPAPPAADPAAPAGAPGSRSFGTISAAIRGPGFVGPVGIPEVASLVAFVAVWTILPFLLPSDLPRIIALAIPAVVASALATEANIRAMPRRSRLAFEAFSWNGEWELKQLGISAFRVPTTRGAAERWLAGHPETPDRLAFRAELLLLAGRSVEAGAAAERLPAGTPWESWIRTETLEAIDWRSGGDGDIEGLRAAATTLLPLDGDEHLRAEVSIAAAEVRRRMADGRSSPGDAADPLIEVRKRLGSRADGQVGRALRLRLFGTFLIVSLAFSGLLEVLGAGGIGLA